MAAGPLLPLITPTSRSTSQGWGGSGSYFSPRLPSPPRNDGEMTALQKLQTMWMAQEAKKNKRGLLGSILHGSWKGISSALDVIARPSYSLAEGTRRALHGDDNDFDVGDFFSGAWAGLSGKKKTGFGQVLGEHDILGRRSRGIVGFGLDVLTDPVMLASLAAVPVTGGGSLSLLSARLAARGLTVKAVQGAAKIAEHGTDDLAALQKAREVLSSAGDGFTARAALADKRIEEVTSKAQGVWTPARSSELHGLQAFARAEARNDLPNVLSFQYKIPFSRASKGKYLENGRVVLRTPVKTVGLKTFADLKIPMVTKTAEQLGKAFKPGWRNEKFHALERVGRATVELREREYIGAIGNHLKPFIAKNSPKFLSTADQLDALDWGETAVGVVKNISDKDGNVMSRVLDREMIRGAVAEGKLTPLQAEFLESWHKATEVLSDADMDYGRLYGSVLKTAKDGNDVIYVPHIYTKDGRKVTPSLGASIMTKPGFQYERLANQPNSVKELKAHYEAGAYTNLVETDPSKLLAMRARRGAQSHADAMVEKIIASSEGIPSKIANVEKQAEHTAKAAERQAKVDALPLASEQGFSEAAEKVIREVSERVDVKRNAALAKHDVRTNALRKEIKALNDSVRRKPGLPSGNQIAHMSSKAFNEMFGKNPKLKNVHAHGQRVRSAYSAAQSARRTIRDFKPEGLGAERVHGSRYRAVLVEMFRDAKMTVPRSTSKSARDLQMAGKHGRAFNRDLEASKRILLDTPMRKRAGDNWEERLKDGIRILEARAKRDWETYLEDIGYKPPPRNRKSIIAAKKRALDLHLKRRDQINERYDRMRDVALSKQLPKLEKKAVNQRKRADVQRKLIAKHERAVQHHETSLPNPEAKRQGYVKNDKIRAENGSAMVIPAEIDEAIRRIRTNIHDDQFLADFQKVWSRLMGRWKVAVTVVNPGYRVRNTISDTWNMWVSGVPLWAIARYGEASAKLLNDAIRKGDPKALALFQEAYEHSVMSGLFGGDIERVLRTMRSGASDQRARDLAKDKKFIAAYTTLATNFNRNAENWGRLTHYLYRRQYEGLSPAAAAQKVRTAHFDYEDLTPFERKVKGNLIPFYTWTRNNVPFQIQAMLTHPGRYSAFPKLQNEMEYAAGEDAGVAPPWVTDAMGFRVPFGGKNNFFIPQFGPSDLSKLQSPEQALGLINPFVKGAAELATNKSFLTGAPIRGSELSHPRSPVSDAAASLLRFIPGSNVGTTARQVKGETMRGPGANPLLTYLAGQTPMTNVFVNQMSGIRRAQRGRNASLLSYFGGISTVAPDKEQTLGIADQDMTEKFRQFVRGLRDEGRWPEVEERELSDFEKRKRKMLESILMNQ